MKASYKKENVEAKSLNVQDLYDHFKNMFGEQYTGQSDTEPDLNQNITCEELDAEFTYSELYSAIFMQNNNKSPGIENITCEIINAPYEFISPFLLKIYGPRQANLVLIAYANSEGSGEPAHPRSLARTFAARSYKQ